MKFVTDMNDRERQRFIDSLKQVREASDAAIIALENKDDAALVMPAMFIGLSLNVLKDLFLVLGQGQAVDMSDLDKPDFGFGPSDGS